MTLAELPKNTPAIVESVFNDADGHWRKLAAFGLMKGSEVLVTQKWPAIVVKLGMTEIGIDSYTAHLVEVRLL